MLAIEALLGKKFHFRRAPKGAAEAAPASPAATAVEVRRQTQIHSESEQTTFQAHGVVTTADGRTIAFSAALTMQRYYRSETTAEVTPATTDPLVVNFGGQPVRLTEARVDFDLDSDGAAESVAFVADGSGFLALDSNGDGAVNDGRELFGPQTGNGFAELASYDADGNGWIDDGDPVFGDLWIWTRDGLYTLAQKGVGALAVSSVETPFELKDSANALLGNVRSSGVYLGEEGTAGTVQQVDLAVE